jgi:hypothetical protein
MPTDRAAVQMETCFYLDDELSARGPLPGTIYSN